LEEGIGIHKILLCIPILSPIEHDHFLFMVSPNIAYENVAGHTFGFLMLQLVLIAVASLNVWFIVEAGIEYKFLGGPKIKYFAFVYLCLNLVISAIKTTLPPTPCLRPAIPVGPLGMVPGQLINYIWMIFNALIPFVSFLCPISIRTTP
jgi:hypothetical protein